MTWDFSPSKLLIRKAQLRNEALIRRRIFRQERGNEEAHARSILNVCEHVSFKVDNVIGEKDESYSMISVTTPDPTVRPPSRIANLSPSSIAMGVIRLIVITTLSPGMHISVPSGRLRSPVTSVVLK